MVMKQNPFHFDMMKMFLNHNPQYAQYINGKHLMHSVHQGLLDEVTLILAHRPELIEYEDKGIVE